MKKVAKSIIALLIAVVMGASLIACSSSKPASSAPASSTPASSAPSAQKKVTLKIGAVEAPDDIVVVSLKKMAELAAQKSGGALEIQVFPGAQLGDASKMIEAVKMGTQDMVSSSGSYMSQFVPDKNIETMFFLFEDENHFLSYLDSDINNSMKDKFTKQTGIKVLEGSYLRGDRNYISKKPLKTLDDFNGLKMRVPDIKGYLKSVEAVGNKPTMVAWSELYIALNQGVVDAAENAPFAMYYAKLHEAAKYLVMTQHLYDYAVIYMNDKKFNSLSPELQKALVEASIEAGEFYTQSVKNSTQECIDNMVKEGLTVIPKSDIDIEGLKKKSYEGAMKLEAEGMWEKGLYDKIKALKK